LPLERLVFFRPRSREDLLWGCEQALRCPGVSATLAGIDRLNDREFRRLQLAAEAGGGLGLLLRPGSAQAEPSWAEVRWKVEPRAALASVQGRWVHIELLRCRGRIDGGARLLEIDDVTHAVRLASPMAPPEVAARPTRAG
jgi:protein ImuA